MSRVSVLRFVIGMLIGTCACGSYLTAACNDPNNKWITRNLSSGATADDTCWTLYDYNSCGPMWRSDRGHIVRAVCGTTENPNGYYVLFGNQIVYYRWVEYGNANWGWGLPCPLFFMAFGNPVFDSIYGSFNQTMSPIDVAPKDCIADDQAPPPEPPPFDTDNDGIYDKDDTDDDGDGVPDNCDMAPLNKNDKRRDCDHNGQEDAPSSGGGDPPPDDKGDYGDCDGDRIFNKYDDDDDNDGCPDQYDPDRCNPNSTCDCDKDGKLDFEDTDDDNDGCPDDEDPDPCDPATRCKSGESGTCDGEKRLRQMMSTISSDISDYATGTRISAITGQAPRMYTFRYPMPNGGFGQIYMDSNFTVEGAALFGVTMNEFRIILRLCIALMMYVKFSVFTIKSFEVI